MNENKVPCGGFELGEGLSLDGNKLINDWGGAVFELNRDTGILSGIGYEEFFKEYVFKCKKVQIVTRKHNEDNTQDDLYENYLFDFGRTSYSEIGKAENLFVCFCANSNLFYPVRFENQNGQVYFIYGQDFRVSQLSFPIYGDKVDNLIKLNNQENYFTRFSDYFREMTHGSPAILVAGQKAVMISYYNYLSTYNSYGCAYYFEPNNQTLYEIKESQANSMIETPYKVLLPIVTEVDNGKILKVVNGQWQAVNPE